MALSDALINLGNQAKELEDSAAGARAENEAKLRTLSCGQLQAAPRRRGHGKRGASSAPCAKTSPAPPLTCAIFETRRQEWPASRSPTATPLDTPLPTS
jgi:hypothetical protein